MEKRPTKARTRSGPRIEIPTKWLICCEGKSEAVYFTDLVNMLANFSGKKNHGIHVGLKNEVCGRKRIPGECSRQNISLLQRVETCAGTGFYDQVWLVFDYDADGQVERGKIHNAFIKTIAEANKLSFGAAWSKPCFEYWLVSHYKYIDACTIKKLNDDLKEKLKTAMALKPMCNKNYRSLPREQHCSKPQPYVCSKCTKKPYYNSIICLGGLSGIKIANVNSNRNYTSNHDKISQSRFTEVSCCTSVFKLVDELFKYFEIDRTLL